MTIPRGLPGWERLSDLTGYDRHRGIERLAGIRSRVDRNSSILALWRGRKHGTRNLPPHLFVRGSDIPPWQESHLAQKSQRPSGTEAGLLEMGQPTALQHFPLQPADVSAGRPGSRTCQIFTEEDLSNFYGRGIFPIYTEEEFFQF